MDPVAALVERRERDDAGDRDGSEECMGRIQDEERCPFVRSERETRTGRSMGRRMDEWREIQRGGERVKRRLDRRGSDRRSAKEEGAGGADAVREPDAVEGAGGMGRKQGEEFPQPLRFGWNVNPLRDGSSG